MHCIIKPLRIKEDDCQAQKAQKEHMYTKPSKSLEVLVVPWDSNIITVNDGGDIVIIRVCFSKVCSLILISGGHLLINLYSKQGSLRRDASQLENVLLI